MKNEVTISAKSVEKAVQLGAEELGVGVENVTYEIIEDAKAGFLGLGSSMAKVKVITLNEPKDAALDFVRRIIADMGINATAEMKPVEGSRKDWLIVIKGEEASLLIGHHGETLDSLQYLVNLAANRREEGEESNYTRISIDIENYRSKREDALRTLARRTANKALKTGRNITLEPMSPYERRIIHSEIQEINGVTTNSIGMDTSRRVMVIVEKDNSKKTRRTKSEPKAAPKQEEEIEYDDNYVPTTTIGPITKRARFDDTLPEYKTGSAMEDEESELK